MASSVRQSAIISGSGVATLSRALPAPTLAGNRLLILAAINESGTLAPVGSVPSAFTEIAPPSPSIRENPAGTPQIRARAYQRKNAAVSDNGSGASETFTVTLTRACDWTLVVVELDGVAATADPTIYQSNGGATQTLSTGSTPVSGSTDSVFVALFAVANIDALTLTAGTAAAGYALTQTSTSGGTAAATKIRTGLATKHSSVSEAGQASVDVGGGFNHNYAALIINFPATAGGGGGGGTLTALGFTGRGYSQVLPGAGPGDWTAYPALNAWSPWFDWHQLNPSEGTYVWTNLDAWLDRAEALGKKICARFVVGNGPDWIFTDASNPVPSIQLRISASAAFERVAVPWNANLRVHYQAFLTALKAHLDTNAAGGTPRRNLIAWIPVGMPSFPGTEMWTVDEGDDNTKSSGFPGTGNMAAWMNRCVLEGAAANFAACDAYRTSQLGTAYDHALDDMRDIVPTVAPNLGAGALFNDGQAKARAIAAARAATMPTLTGMETNGRPNGGDVDTNPSVAGIQAQITGLWKEWCGGCHTVATAFIAAGLPWGMQTAAIAIFNRFTAGGATPQAAFQYMCRDLIGYLDPTDLHYATRYDYPLTYLEVNPEAIAANYAYIRDVAQPQLMAQSGGTPPPPPANAGPPTITMVSAT